MKRTTPETAIIKQCQKGNPQAFAKMLTLYGKRLYAYFYRATNSVDDAEDLLQELFVKLIEKIKSYQDKGQFEHWLFRIAANMVRDRYRRQAHSHLSLDQDRPNQRDTIADSLAGNEPAPWQPLETREQCDQLQTALNQLPELDRELILARHFGAMGFKDLAQEFALPLGTVLAKVHRGLKTLRRILDHETATK